MAKDIVKGVKVKFFTCNNGAIAPPPTRSDMGCGFSSEDSKASDEERILKSTPTSSGSSTSSELKLGAKGKKTG